MKVLQINSVVNSGSTGRIAEDIGKVLIKQGHESFIAYGRGNRPSKSKLIKIDTGKDIYLHGLKSLLFDRHGFGSVNATKRLIKRIEEIKPDVILLHNLHGYYINIEILFDFLTVYKRPVLWTLFDCWAFTGHCSYFDDINCTKWKYQCEKCPKIKAYPASLLIDNSHKNYLDKKRLFNSCRNMEIVVHSHWLAGLVKESFLKKKKIHVTPSGIDIDKFKPVLTDLKEKYKLKNKKIVLGCASPWSKRKGFDDFLELRKLLNNDFHIVLVGLNKKQINLLPEGILGLSRTDSVEELAGWYSIADVFVNPTHTDNFPTTNLEALACGTPVITYNTGGSPEAVDQNTGIVVNKGDIGGLKEAVEQVIAKGKSHFVPLCRKRAELLFNKDERYLDYINIMENMNRSINKKQFVFGK